MIQNSLINQSLRVGKTPGNHIFSSSCTACACLGFQPCDCPKCVCECVCVCERERERERDRERENNAPRAADGVSASLKSFPSRDLKWQHPMLGVHRQTRSTFSVWIFLLKGCTDRFFFLPDGEGRHHIGSMRKPTWIYTTIFNQKECIFSLSN